MGKKFAAMGLLLLLLGTLGACGRKSIPVYCKSVYVSTMEYMPEPGSEETKTEEPEYEECILTGETALAYGVSGISIRENSVTFRYDENCIRARVYSADADGPGTFLREGKHGKVTLQKGEELVLEEIALLDASHTVYIRLK